MTLNVVPSLLVRLPSVVKSGSPSGEFIDVCVRACVCVCVCMRVCPWVGVFVGGEGNKGKV